MVQDEVPIEGHDRGTIGLQSFAKSCQPRSGLSSLVDLMKPLGHLPEQRVLCRLQLGLLEVAFNRPTCIEELKIDGDLREQLFDVRKTCCDRWIERGVVELDDLGQAPLGTSVQPLPDLVK